jgi:hypothetical protein
VPSEQCGGRFISPGCWVCYEKDDSGVISHTVADHTLRKSLTSSQLHVLGYVGGISDDRFLGGSFIALLLTCAGAGNVAEGDCTSDSQCVKLLSPKLSNQKSKTKNNLIQTKGQILAISILILPSPGRSGSKENKGSGILVTSDS